MPIGARKNTLYGIALPVLGLRAGWRNMSEGGKSVALSRLLHKHHVVGGCIQILRKGALAERYCFGYANIAAKIPVTSETVFRTASVTKAVVAMLVFRLQTLGKLDVDEPIDAFWEHPIRNPHCPDTPIPLVSLLNHTSGIVDSQSYFDSFRSNASVDEILADGACFAARQPGERFQYSNFAAGLVGSLLEHRFGVSLEKLAQRELFRPLGVTATFAPTDIRIANSYRVLPPSRTPAFEMARRPSRPMELPDPQHHVLAAAGGLFVTAPELAKLLLPLAHGGAPLLDGRSFSRMTTPTTNWSDQTIRLRHGAGLLQLDDRSVSPRPLLGHQGFAYGAVNGFFLDADGNGFVSLNSGASERRVGHLSLLNRDLIRLLLTEDDQ